MNPVLIVILVIFVILAIALVVLTILGRRAQKRQEEQQAQMEAEAAAPICPTIAASIYCIMMVVICARIAGRLSRQARPIFSRVVILVFCKAAVTFIVSPVSKNIQD